jgi:RNA polymerase sigma-70 factor (ECF subfamily)
MRATSRARALRAFEAGARSPEDVVIVFRMDEDAFRGFYDRTARQLKAYLLRLTGEHSAAEDLLQDAYYRFLRADANLETEAHRRHYLFRIATNLAADRVRRRRAAPTDTSHDPDQVPTPAADIALNRRIDVASALDRLRVRDRAMLWLAYAQGASHDEIAQVVGLRASSIKPLLLRARRRLASFLRADDQEPRS